MVKSNSLNSDIEFIKEFEELKIKQKLLVESLSKKKHAFKDELLVNINSKLDFLVKIFQEAQEPSGGENADVNKGHFESILTSITTLDENLNERLDKIEADIDSIKSGMNKSVSVSSTKVSNESLPPTPDFGTPKNSESGTSSSPKPNSVPSEKIIPKTELKKTPETKSEVPPKPSEKTEEKKKGKWF